MKQKKDISDLIRDNQHKLEERPSPRAWNKLEEKLDGQLEQPPKRKSTLIYRRLALAAAVVLLVGVISVLNFNNNSQSKDVAAAKWDSDNLETIANAGDEDFRKLIERQRRLKNATKNSIQEGDQTKKLLALNRTPPNAEFSFTETSTTSKVQQEPLGGIAYDANDKVLNKSNRPSETIEEMKEFDDAAEADIIVTDAVAIEEKEELRTEDAASIILSEPSLPAKENAKSSKPLKKKNFKDEWSWIEGNWKGGSTQWNFERKNNTLIENKDFSLIKTSGTWKIIFKKNDKDIFLLKKSENGLMVFENKNKDTISIERKGNDKFEYKTYNNSTLELLRKVFKKN